MTPPHLSGILMMAPLPPQRCGVSSHAFHLARYLSARGLRPVALTYRECGRGEDFADACIRVRRLPTLVRPDRVPFIRALLYVVAGIGPAIALVRREKIRLIHAHGAIPQGLLACILGRVVRVPYIYTAHGAELTLHNARGKIFRKITARVIARAAAATSVCRENLEYLGRFNKRSVHIPNGISDDFVDRYARSNRRLEGNGAPARILFVGHVNPVKGVDVLIAAAESWARDGGFDFHLTIAGGGSPRTVGRYRRDVQTAGLADRVVFAGIRTDVPRLLAEADIFVQPSRMEGLPTALLEAMAVGVPVVAAAAGGIPDLVVHGKNGLLVPPGDAPALAEAVRRLAADRDLRKRLAEGGFRTVPAYRWSAIGGAYLDLYGTIEGSAS